MTRVYVADTLSQERSALRLVLQDLQMEVVGEAADWTTTLAKAPETRFDMVLLDWSLLPDHLAGQSLKELRLACANPIIIVLISQMDAKQQSSYATGADEFISKGEPPSRVAEHLCAAAAKVQSGS